MSKTKIEWTDFTWNFVTGCNKVSAGCKNCYAEMIAKRFWKDRKFTDVQIDESKLDLPLHLKKSRMIFVNSMSDLFHEKVSNDVIYKAFEIMQTSDQHIFQILTKRPKEAMKIIGHDQVAENIWLGVSVENQQTADERIPLLLQIPAAVRWLSIEPLLEPISFESLEGIDWVVIGAESGRKRRDCNIVWIEHIIKQCKTVGNYLPVFIKQLQINGKVVKDINQLPKHLQVREWPRVASGQ